MTDKKKTPKKKKAPKKNPPRREFVNTESGLTHRQEAFARQFLFPHVTDAYPVLHDYDTTMNGARAVVRAGYSKKGSSVTASRLLGNVNVQAYMAKLKQPALDQFEITRERLVQELAFMAFGNISDFMKVNEETGEAWIDVSNASREQMAALSSFEVTELPPMKLVEDGEEVTHEVLKTKIKMSDKRPAIESLLKLQGMAEPEKVEVTVTQKLDSEDRIDMAKRVAFMLRKSAHEAEKAKSGAKKAPKKPVKKKKPTKKTKKDK